MIEFVDLERMFGTGARDAWERLCVSLIQRRHPSAQTVRPNPGDGGIDCFLRTDADGTTTVWQCKYFPDRIGEAQKDQIRSSFAQALNTVANLNTWTLCIPIDLSLQELDWWDKWRIGKGVNITLWTGSQIKSELLIPENSPLRREFFGEFNEASLNLEVVSFSSEFSRAYDCRLRLYNDVAVGKTAIFTRLFCEVTDCREHPYEMAKRAYLGPIGVVQANSKEKPLYFPPKPAKWELLKEDRKFPPNEVEDITFSFQIATGWMYLIRFGVTWYIPGDREMRKSHSRHWYLIGNPHENTDDQDEDLPPPGFLDEPRALIEAKWP